ncbi:porin family protein [Sediminibacterium salmoneum]|uniref:porin family protein n=1 Tax=Sediminibacterium salmoneum TaxID=426421 RepID=UPI000479BC83|nr:porin family protein [Sediminibacterium salmoneum]
MRKILFVALLVFSGTLLHAQTGFRLGVKAGANLNKIDGQSFDQGFNFSYHAGAFAEIDFAKRWGIQPEVIWSQTATKPATNLDAIYTTLPTNVKLDYLMVPILLRYSPIGLLSFVAGPQFGVLINKNENLLSNGQQAFKSGDFSMVLGAQVNLKVLRIYGRYNIGLQNINDFTDQQKWNTQQVQLGLGLKF